MWIVWLEKKIFKTLGIILAILIILITTLHFYVVNNAETLLEELVKKESNDKLRLKVKNIKFNYFSKRVELEQVSFFSNDSLNPVTSYHFNVENIRLQVKALLPIFTRKELLIDSIYLTAPDITVTRLKPMTDTGTEKVSIPEEMGRIYNSIMDALKFFQVTRFEMNEGKFTLVNKIHPDQLPLTISNLHIHIDNLKIDSTADEKNLFFSDQMLFRTRNQDILFPDGNHRLAFSRFRINIRRKFIQIDSCTLIGKRPDNDRSEFKIFLDTLRLINVDFKALYEKELIKADTVYLRNPDFNIQLELKERSGINAKNKPPNLDTLIQQLTGDLLLNYIGVTNAGIKIITYRDGNPTSFSSDHNNFEMKGLSIDQSRPNPVLLEGFDMAIHNYENFVKDSSYFLRFDSIRLRENKILLSNFSVNTEPFKDNRNIKVQQFALSGLSWSELLFNRKIKAMQATLINPQIDYVQPLIAKNMNQKDFLSSLNVINKIMSLEKLQMINGLIKIKARNQTEILLQNTGLTLNSREVVKSPTVTNVEQSVEELNFSKGILKLKNLLVNMDQAFFDGDKNRLLVEKLNFYNPDQSFNVNSKKTLLVNIQFDDSLNIVSADSVNWGQAGIEVNIFPKETRKNNSPVTFDLKILSGKNTAVDINSENSALSFILNTITANSFSKKEKIRVEELNTSGKNFSFFRNGLEIKSDSFSIHDFSPSVVNSVLIKQNRGENLLALKIPSATFIPDINSVVSENTEIQNLKLQQPELTIITNEKAASKEKKPFPSIKINRLELEGPVFKLTNLLSAKLPMLTWNGSKNKLIAADILSEKDQISLSSVQTDLSDFSFTHSSGKVIHSNEMYLRTNFENLVLQNDEKIKWSVKLKELLAQNFTADSFNKKPVQFKIHSGKAEGLSFSSEHISSLPELIRQNPHMTVRNISGYFIDEKKNINWKNLVYDKSAKTISLDTFTYNPVMNRDDFIAASAFQTDYMTLSSGKIEATEFDLDRFLEDSILRLGDLNITNPYFTSYRDKRPPFRAGIIKPLPSKLIQKIPFPISIDTIKIINGSTVYSELNDKNNETGVIPVTRMSGDIFPIKNFDLTKNDSLRIRLNGYLLDSAWIRLRTRESYTDSLSGFLITLRMRPRSLLYLNEILEPLASVKIQSGNLDTLLMRAVATEYLSLGEMRLFYRDLKVKFLRNSSEDKKRFLTGLMTFIANSFVIKNENKKRVGVVYFPRLRDRSFINYYIKIAMSGMASSVGAKKNKKLMRRYKKHLKIRQLPPIEFD